MHASEARALLLRYNHTQIVHQLFYKIVDPGDFCSQVLVNEGYNVATREIDLVRLADVSTLIYVCLCLLSRASRSYAGGHAHNDHELQLACAFINEIKFKVDYDLVRGFVK